mmetsp:Transcript_81017/g.224104  ORF Transcript_81017/g.224104 Transcript_81017/m.224104 type:complete len:320 (-) Transcript_81017:153-1112(-)
MADPTPHQLGAAATDSDGPPDRPLLKALGERSFALDSAERPGAPAAPSPSEPLRDFSVKMPNLMTQEVDFQGLPDQIRVALAFLRSFCPQDLMRDEVVAHFPPLLPPQSKEHRGRRTLVLDLDETLVHCHPSLLVGSPPPALHLRIDVTSPPLNAHVYVRPFAQLMLALVAKVFEVVVFTASAAIYADQVLDFLDPDHTCVAYRLYRQHCTEIAGGHFKDMRRLGRRLEDVMLVDNSPLAAGLSPNNGIFVSSWFGEDYADVELVDLLTVLDQCCLEASIPAFLAKRYGFGAFLQQQRQQQRLAVGAAGVFGMPPFTLV